MAKFHLNAKGEPGVCRAQAGGCPFGGADEHYDSKDEARSAFEALQAMPAGLKKELTRAQISALTSYQGGFYEELNYGLRVDESDWTPRHHEIVEHLDSLFAEPHFTPPPTVHRVVYTGDSVGYLDFNLTPGSIITEHGYFSTSESDEFVEDCLDNGLNDEPVNTHLTIEVPPDAHCVRPASHTYDRDHEEEILFGRDLEFEVLEDNRSGRRRYIHLRMLSPGEPREQESAP